MLDNGRLTGCCLVVGITRLWISSNERAVNLPKYETHTITSILSKLKERIIPLNESCYNSVYKNGD